MLWSPILVLAFTGLTIAVGPLVDVGTQYRGRIVGDGTTQWLGMRYAAAPVGDLRFKAPQDPPEVDDVQDASKFGPICISGDLNDWTNKHSSRFTVSEDCLFINVFAPSNATTDSGLPVMYFIQGGGFSSNSNNNFNGSDLARKGNLIVASINYRVGPFGFLRDRNGYMQSLGDTNNGIRDMIKGMQWVKKHIEKFGGDSSRVVLNGDSAGATAIAIFLTSSAARDQNLFVGAIAESTYNSKTVAEVSDQKNFACLNEGAGCAGEQTTAQQLTCLCERTPQQLQTAMCSFGPLFDNNTIDTSIIDGFKTGKIAKVPTIFGTTADEGTQSIPDNVTTLADLHNIYLQGCPYLSNASLAKLDDTYLTNANYSDIAHKGKYWHAGSAVISDMHFHCPTNNYQDLTVAAGVPTWQYRYNVVDPDNARSGKGAYHTVELNAVWGPNNTDGSPPKSYYTTNANIVDLIQRYWISFVHHLDPNPGRSPDAPEWKPWSLGQRLVVQSGNATRSEATGESERAVCTLLKGTLEVNEVDPPNGTIVNL